MVRVCKLLNLLLGSIINHPSLVPFPLNDPLLMLFHRDLDFIMIPLIFQVNVLVVPTLAKVILPVALLENGMINFGLAHMNSSGR